MTASRDERVAELLDLLRDLGDWYDLDGDIVVLGVKRALSLPPQDPPGPYVNVPTGEYL